MVETIDKWASFNGGGWMAFHPSGNYLYVTRGGRNAGEFFSGNQPPAPSGCIYTIDTSSYNIVSINCPPWGPAIDEYTRNLGQWLSELTALAIHPFGTYVYFSLVHTDFSKGSDGLGVLNTTTGKFQTLNRADENALFVSVKITPDIDKAPTIIETNATAQSDTCLLGGTLNPNGLNTKYYFEYGLTELYGNETIVRDTGLSIQYKQ